MDFRDQLIKRYPYLYPTTEIEEEETDPYAKLNYDAEKEFNDEFGYYSMVYKAAGGNYLKINDVLQSDLEDFLFFINYTIRLNELENQRIQKANNKS